MCGRQCPFSTARGGRPLPERMRAAGAPSRRNDERSQRAGASVRNRPPRDERQAPFRLGLGRASVARDRGRRAHRRRRRLAEAAAGRFRPCPSRCGARISARFATRGRRASSSLGIPRPVGAQAHARSCASTTARRSGSTSLTWSNRDAPATGNSASSYGLRARQGAGCAAATFAGSRAGRSPRTTGRPRSTTSKIVARLVPQLAGTSAVTLAFDHNLGGGANQYRRQMIGDTARQWGDRPPLHVQPPNARLSAAGFPAGRRRGHLPDVVVPGPRTDHRQGARHRDLSQQPRLVRRAPGVRGLDRHDSARSSRRPG